MIAQSVPAWPLDSKLSTLQDEIKVALYGLDAQMTQVHPRRRPQAWSIQHIVQHLLLTYESTSQLLASRIAKGSAPSRPLTLREKMIQKFVLGWELLPKGISAPEAVWPQKLVMTPMNGEQLTSETDRRLREMEQFLCLAASKPGSGPCATHGILGPMSVDQWRKFHLVHGRHHLKQIAFLRGEIRYISIY
jgi:hypothetical protein